MSAELLVILTVVESVVLVAVLALFVILITERLRSVADALEEVSGGKIPGIQANVALLGAGSALLNRKLDAIANVLPAMAEKAESMASSAQDGSPAGGSQTPQHP